MGGRQHSLKRQVVHVAARGQWMRGWLGEACSKPATGGAAAFDAPGRARGRAAGQRVGAWIRNRPVCWFCHAAADLPAHHKKPPVVHSLLQRDGDGGKGELVPRDVLWPEQGGLQRLGLAGRKREGRRQAGAEQQVDLRQGGQGLEHASCEPRSEASPALNRAAASAAPAALTHTTAAKCQKRHAVLAAANAHL